MSTAIGGFFGSEPGIKRRVVVVSTLADVLAPESRMGPIYSGVRASDEDPLASRAELAPHQLGVHFINPFGQIAGAVDGLDWDGR